MTLGSQLKDARVSQGRTQADVALAALISPSEYCRIECDRRIPRPSVWWALTEALALEPRDAVRLGVRLKSWTPRKGDRSTINLTR